MKKSFYQVFLIGIILCALHSALGAQTLKPFTKLRVLQTEHFEIIFPEQSRQSAYKLAATADQMYERVSSLLNIQLRGRVPVLITPHTDQFNGYFSSAPYPHIVLYDTPASTEWTSFSDSLESLFLHELTHAVSLNTRDTWLDVLHRIFGAWVTPALINAPFFMVEGVTVSFESLDGFGRANDPLVKQRLRQAIKDGAFLSPMQVSSVYDLPPAGQGGYEYGGLFSAYLQKKYGMEAYCELWRLIGAKFSFSLDPLDNAFYRLFKDVYGLPFQRAWADFAYSLGHIDMEDGERVLSGEQQIKAVRTDGQRLYYLDSVLGWICAWTPNSDNYTKVLRVDSSTYDFDISPDGTRLLVSTYAMFGDLATAIVKEYLLKNRSATGRKFTGLYHGRYMGSAIVGLGSDQHANQVVLEHEDGQREVLLQGSASLLYSAPAVIDESRFATLAMVEGVRRLVVYNLVDDSLLTLRAESEEDRARWRYVRGLQAVQGVLYASYSGTDDFYRLLRLDMKTDTESLVFSEHTISGGVFLPVQIGSDIYYKGMFSTWDALMHFPETVDALSGRQEIPVWEAWVPQLPEPIQASEYPEKGYNGLKYLNPLKFWFPLPLLDTSRNSTNISGFVIASILSDPLDMNMIQLEVAGDFLRMMAPFTIIWDTLSLGVPLRFGIQDQLANISTETSTSLVRVLRGSFQIPFQVELGSRNRHLQISPLVNVVALFPDPRDGSGAYTWPWQEVDGYVGGIVGISDWRRLSYKIFGQGVGLSAKLSYTFLDSTLRAEGLFKAGFGKQLPMRLSVYGAWDSEGMSLDGYSTVTGAALFDAASIREYADADSPSVSWLSGAELEALLFSLEVHSNISHVYINRLFASVAWRGGVYAQEAETDPGTALGDTGLRLAHSAVLRAGMVASSSPLGMIGLRMAPHIWFAMRLSNLEDTDADNDYLWGIALDIEW